MSNKNRFADLMGAAGGDEEQVKPSEQLDGQTSKKSSKRLTEKDGKDTPYRKKYKQGVLRGQLLSKGKSSSSDYDKVTVYIHSDIAHALRVVAAVEKQEMSQLVEEAVLEALLKSPTGKQTLEQSDV